MIKPILEFLVRELVEAPDDVVVTEYESINKTTYEVIVADDDIGKVIGKNGRIARAIRVLVKGIIAGDKHEVNIVIKGDQKRRRRVEAAAETAPDHTIVRQSAVSNGAGWMPSTHPALTASPRFGRL